MRLTITKGLNKAGIRAGKHAPEKFIFFGGMFIEENLNCF